jgi:hypothetical protein
MKIKMSAELHNIKNRPCDPPNDTPEDILIDIN